VLWERRARWDYYAVSGMQWIQYGNTLYVYSFIPVIITITMLLYMGWPWRHSVCSNKCRYVGSIPVPAVYRRKLNVYLCVALYARWNAWSSNDHGKRLFRFLHLTRFFVHLQHGGVLCQWRHCASCTGAFPGCLNSSDLMVAFSLTYGCVKTGTWNHCLLHQLYRLSWQYVQFF